MNIENKRHSETENAIKMKSAITQFDFKYIFLNFSSVYINKVIETFSVQTCILAFFSQ